MIPTRLIGPIVATAVRCAVRRIVDDEWTSPLAGVDPELAVEDHPIWKEIEPEGEWGGFRVDEFKRPHAMDVHFLRLLYWIRLLAGVPMWIKSDARDPGGSVGVSLSAHKKRPCRAVDVYVANRTARARVLIACALLGIVRVGVYEGNDHDGGSVHVDAETDPENPSPRCWTHYRDN